ncbi:uncharacterized protein BX663DRAFT_554629 [Cokeromyces recurvatus]|uniref:uncharacterized protein n=1 Tax=Cokeromyces recurvatus TaxID=90255 RepID=UPI00221EF669|nr:uncharacterized protein BX663DRAFT_554629 [Cokeromyces recurvatus]KAI7899673.1 hypothetical protein BX663DRAFT_554629 [Cokeromyces recurvatus]
MELALVSVFLLTDSPDVENQRDILLGYHILYEMWAGESLPWRQTILLTSIPLPHGSGQLLVAHLTIEKFWTGFSLRYVDSAEKGSDKVVKRVYLQVDDSRSDVCLATGTQLRLNLRVTSQRNKKKAADLLIGKFTKQPQSWKYYTDKK